MSAKWTESEIIEHANNLTGTNTSKFYVPLRYIFVNNIANDSFTNLAKSTLKTLHSSLVFSTFASRKVTAGGETKTTPLIFFSESSTIADDHVTDVTATITLDGSNATVDNVINQVGANNIPNDNSLVVLVVKDLNISGVPISHLDTHSLIGKNMISRVGVISSRVLGISNHNHTIYSDGHLLIHVLGHMLGLPHTFDYGDCDATFKSDSARFESKKLSQVHGGGFADQKYDNLWVNDVGAGSNVHRQNSDSLPKPFDVGKLEAIVYACDTSSSTQEGFQRFMDVAPDKHTSYFTENNAKLMRENLMMYDLRKGTSDTKKVYDLNVRKNAIVVTDTNNNNDNNDTNNDPPAVVPSTTAQKSDGLSTGALIGIVVGSVVGLFLLVALFWWVRKRMMKKSPEEAKPPVLLKPMELPKMSKSKPPILSKSKPMELPRMSKSKPPVLSKSKPMELPRMSKSKPPVLSKSKPPRMSKSKPPIESVTSKSGGDSDFEDLDMNFEDLGVDDLDLDNL